MDPAMKNVVGPRIREARYSGGRKVSQEVLVAHLQTLGIPIDQTALSRIENGQRAVTDVEILAICRVLDMGVDQLFSGLELPPE